jgi:hypothetical protein
MAVSLETANEVLRQHKLWLAGDGGARANMSGANLTGAKGI